MKVRFDDPFIIILVKKIIGEIIIIAYISMESINYVSIFIIRVLKKSNRLEI